MSCEEVVRLIGGYFDVKIVEITLKMKNIVLRNDSVYANYVSYTPLRHFLLLNFLKLTQIQPPISTW